MPRFDKLEFSEGPKRSQENKKAEAPKKEKRDASYWHSLADQERRKGLHENALRFYSRALEAKRSLVACWVGQVQMLVMLDEPRQASTWTNTGLKLFPNNPDLMAGRAQAQCRLSMYSQAHELSDAALRISGESVYGWVVRGEIMLATKQTTEGHCFDSAQQLSDDWLVPIEIARIYLYYRTPAKALLRATHALEKAPDAPYCWYVQGLAQQKSGLHQPACNSFERCLELLPDHRDALDRLSELRHGGSFTRRFLQRIGWR